MSKTQYTTVFLLVFAAVLTVVFALFQNRFSLKIAQPAQKPVTIEMNAQGFVPSVVTVEVNSTVCWVNAGNVDRHPVSDALSPTPFDPGKGISAGETWCYPFSTVGLWMYHEKDKPDIRGSVTVGAK
jgi:plastocyanin